MLFCISYLWDAPYNRMCILEYVRETAWISMLTSCSRRVDAVSMFVHKSTTCQYICVHNLAAVYYSLVLPVNWLWQTDKALTLQRCVYQLGNQWVFRVKWCGMVRDQHQCLPYIALLVHQQGSYSDLLQVEVIILLYIGLSHYYKNIPDKSYHL